MAHTTNGKGLLNGDLVILAAKARYQNSGGMVIGYPVDVVSAAIGFKNGIEWIKEFSPVDGKFKRISRADLYRMAPDLSDKLKEVY